VTVGNGWVTASRMLPTTRKLAVSSFARAIKIYDVQTFEQCGQIANLDDAVMAMDAWAPSRNREVAWHPYCGCAVECALCKAKASKCRCRCTKVFMQLCIGSA
jgi:hypothetical protein